MPGLQVVGAEGDGTASSSNVLERLEERNQQRKMNNAARQAERVDAISDQDNMRQFHDRFNDMMTQVAEGVKAASHDRPNAKEILDGLTPITSQAQALVAEGSLYLSVHDLKKAQDEVHAAKALVAASRTDLVPKKSFAFKSKAKSRAKAKAKLASEEATSAEVLAAKAALPTQSDARVVKDGQYCYAHHTGERLEYKDTKLLEGHDFELASLTECTVILKGSTSALYISKLTNCNAYVGPVSGAVFISDCVDCTFLIACHQIRVHTSTRNHIFAHVTSNPIIEHCTEMTFGKYNWT